MKRSLSALAAVLVSGAVSKADSYWEPGYSGDTGGSLGNPAEISYGYLELGYFNQSFDLADFDLVDGGYGELSIPLFESFYLKGGLGLGQSDGLDGVSADFLKWRAGPGVKIPIFKPLHFVLDGGVQYERFENDDDEELFSDMGFYVSPALRLMIGRVAEIQSGVTYQKIDAHGDFGLDLKGLVHFTHRFSAFGGVNFFEEGNQYGVGVRLSF